MALCRDKGFHVATGLVGQAHDLVWASATSLCCVRDWNARATVLRACATKTLSPVSRQNFRVPTWFGAVTRWTGSQQRFSLSRRSPFGSVSRQDVVKAGRPSVATQKLTRWRYVCSPACAVDEFYRNRLLKVFCRDREFVQPLVATRLGAGAAEACRDGEPWTHDRAHNTRYCAQSMRTAMHATDLTQCTVLYIV